MTFGVLEFKKYECLFISYSEQKNLSVCKIKNNF